MAHEDREVRIAKEVAELYALPEEKRTAKLMELQVRNTLTVDSIDNRIDNACMRLDSVEEIVKKLPCIGSNDDSECKSKKVRRASKVVLAATFVGTLLGSFAMSVWNLVK
jgi:hypothetical protein